MSKDETLRHFYLPLFGLMKHTDPIGEISPLEQQRM